MERHVVTYPPPPLTGADRDTLIRTLTRQCADAEEALRERDATIRSLTRDLAAAHVELAAYKAGTDDKAMPFQP